METFFILFNMFYPIKYQFFPINHLFPPIQQINPKQIKIKSIHNLLGEKMFSKGGGENIFFSRKYTPLFIYKPESRAKYFKTEFLLLLDFR